MSALSNQLLLQKTELVLNKLINLGEANGEQDKQTARSEIKKGFIARDFGIKEWDWPQGVGLYGLQKLESFFDDGRYASFFKEWFESNIKRGLPSKNINTTAPYLALIDYAERIDNDSYRQMCLKHAEWLINELPKTKEGGFQHVTTAIGNRDGINLNESELWIDTLFMAVLFLCKAGRLHRNSSYINEAAKQVLIHIKYLYEKKNGLFYHGWSFNRNNNYGGIFWCRGNAWFTYGILEIIDACGDMLENGLKEFFTDTFKAQAAALKSLQAKSGLWHTVLTDEESYEEVSGSCFFAAGMLKGVKMGILPQEYKACALKTISALCENIDNDGTVLNVSAGTGIGENAEHYKQIIKAPMAYGQSMALIALSETLAQ
ncbi:MAG TPA: glycoside hydrolase 105 family protein [Ruminococcaceae bacterium]|nr:glycoside hydrolase 105 family protein [Oscillospiraceae bacterium]